MKPEYGPTLLALLAPRHLALRVANVSRTIPRVIAVHVPHVTPP
mgnify:CR=1 FL=1